MYRPETVQDWPNRLTPNGSAVNRLAEAGILVQRNIGRQRYRIFEAPEVLDLFTSLERALASPSGDTATAPPVRPVPRR